MEIHISDKYKIKNISEHNIIRLYDKDDNKVLGFLCLKYLRQLSDNRFVSISADLNGILKFLIIIRQEITLFINKILQS